MSIFNLIFNKKIKPQVTTPKVFAVEIMGDEKELIIFHSGRRYLLAENSMGFLKLYQ